MHAATRSLALGLGFAALTLAGCASKKDPALFSSGSAGSGSGSGGTTGQQNPDHAETCPAASGPCGSFELVPFEGDAAAMRAHGDFLYWRKQLQEGDTGELGVILRVHRDGGELEQLGLTTNPRGLAVGDAGMFFTSDEGVGTTPLEGGTLTMLDTNYGMWWDIAVDDARAYYTDYLDGSGAYSVPVEGGTNTKLATLNGCTEIAEEGDYVYLTDNGAAGPDESGNIYRVAKAGGEPEVIYGPSTHRPEDLTADADALYWHESPYVMRLFHDTNELETVWTSVGDEEVQRVIPHTDGIYLLVYDRYRSPNHHIVRLDRADPTQAVDVVDFPDITSLVVSGSNVYFSAITDEFNGIFFADRCGCP
jgi:hypothetical protein